MLLCGQQICYQQNNLAIKMLGQLGRLPNAFIVVGYKSQISYWVRCPYGYFSYCKNRHWLEEGRCRATGTVAERSTGIGFMSVILLMISSR
jgi:hypothetical protein